MIEELKETNNKKMNIYVKNEKIIFFFKSENRKLLKIEYFREKSNRAKLYFFEERE